MLEIRTSDVDQFIASYVIDKKILSSFFNFIRENYNVKIDIRRSKTAVARHGKMGIDVEKAKRTIDDQVLFDLLNLNSLPDLSPFDRLMVNALAINVSCGLRITELMTLPVDCIIEVGNETFIRSITTKGGSQAPRPIHPIMAPIVREAVATIIELTNEGREAARNWCNTSDPDWRRVAKDHEALVYFSQKILHDWTSNPDKRIINSEAAWHRHRGWIDVLGTLERTGSVSETLRKLSLDDHTFRTLKAQQEASRQGRAWTGNRKTRTAWSSDSRVCNIGTLCNRMGYSNVGRLGTAEMRRLVETALSYQLIGQVMPLPDFNEEFERKYSRTRAVLLQDEQRQPILLAEDALFALPAFFVGSHNTDVSRWQCLDFGQVARWFAGSRSHASIFSRYNIIDRRTGLIAKLSSHAIRHWFETQLQKGGITDLQASKIMNRKTVSSGSVYNQTSNADKRKMLADGISDGSVCGPLPDAIRYHKLTREEAEDVLSSRLMHINIMPHGFCMQNLAMVACPHHMSCFAAHCKDSHEKSACVHLIVDLRVKSQLVELNRERSNALAMVESMSDDENLDDSPQIEHFRTIARSIEKILSKDDY